MTRAKIIEDCIFAFDNMVPKKAIEADALLKKVLGTFTETVKPSHLAIKYTGVHLCTGWEDCKNFSLRLKYILGSGCEVSNYINIKMAKKGAPHATVLVPGAVISQGAYFLPSCFKHDISAWLNEDTPEDIQRIRAGLENENAG